MIASSSLVDLPDSQRIVITGIGLTAPSGNDLATFRSSLLEGRSGVREFEVRYFGKTLAGVCDFAVPAVPIAARTPPWHPRRFGGHLQQPGGGARQWPGLGERRQVAGGHLRRRDRARQRRDGKRDLPDQGIRLRHVLLVPPPQSRGRWPTTLRAKWR